MSVAEGVNEFMEQVFTYGRAWNVILRAVRADPWCPLANVLAADYFVAKEDLKAALFCLEVGYVGPTGPAARPQAAGRSGCSRKNCWLKKQCVCLNFRHRVFARSLIVFVSSFIIFRLRACVGVALPSRCRYGCRLPLPLPIPLRTGGCRCRCGAESAPSAPRRTARSWGG